MIYAIREYVSMPANQADLLAKARRRMTSETHHMIEDLDYTATFDYEQSRDHIRIMLKTDRAKRIHPGVWCAKFHDYPYGGTYMLARHPKGHVIIYVTSLETTMTDGM